MKVKCPKCGTVTNLGNNPFRPFCSERCKLIDLGNWLDGAYAVPTAPEEAEDEIQESGKDPEDA